MRAAIIGNGGIAVSHRNAYKALKEEGSDIVLQAICDIRPEKLEDNDGANVYTDIDAMLEAEKDNIDYVDICLPTYLHAEVAIKCMKAGFHVLCEKPMALYPEETERMLECSKETGKKLMIAHCCRFNSPRYAVHDLLMKGVLGKPKSALFSCINGYPGGWDLWFRDGDRSGGAILDLQAHNLDLITWYFGMPKSTSTVATVDPVFKSGYSSVSSNLIYEDGFYAHLWTDWTIKGNEFQNRQFRINCENGYIYVDLKKEDTVAMAKWVENDEWVRVDLTENPEFTGTGFKHEIEYFVTCIKNKVGFSFCAPEESAKVVKIMRAQEKSADNGGMPVIIEE